MQGVDKMIEASEESLAKYNEGYREGFSDGYDVALEKAREVAEKYNLGVDAEEKELKPAVKFMGISLADQINKIHSELTEVISAYMDKEGEERIADLVCKTGADNARAEAQHVCIVMCAGHLGAENVAAKSGTNALVLVCG